MPVRQLLREQGRDFRLLFEKNPQPMWVLDAETQRFLEVNSAACKLYGYSLREFRALAITQLQAPPPAGERPASTRHSAVVWRHRAKNGRAMDVEIIASDIRYGGRKAKLAVVLDITGRRQLEDRLRQAQKMESVGMLAGGVAHDFNNLLTIITGYSQLILNNLRPADINRHAAEQIVKAGERAAALTRQLLAFSRRQALQPRVLDLNQLITSLSAMLQRLIGEDVDLRLALRPDLGRVNADAGQVEQVLMNLVVNSRDAMPSGGTLTIETSNVRLEERYTDRDLTVPPGSYVLLAVSDNGHGMDSETKTHLFEPFFTTKTSGKGTGLGLSTVFGIVKQSGGSMGVYSELQVGTSVKVYLPRVDRPAAVESERPKIRATRGSETILVVEDDDMVRHLVRETLQTGGYRTLDAASPVEAQRIAGEWSEGIQLLITDVVMPKASGRELADSLTIQRPDMKVLYMSGYTDSAVINNGILRREVAFLQKPFTPVALTEKVRDVLEGRGMTHSAGE